MKLRQYLTQAGKTQEAFAAEVPCSQARVSAWCNGEMPRAAMMKRIMELTDGQVAPNDWIVEEGAA